MKTQIQNRHKKLLRLCGLALCGFLLLSCAGQNSNQNVSSPAPVKKLTEFERILKSLRTADFDYIFAIKRQDGEAFNSNDKKFVKANTHYATNRFRLTDDEKVVFAGSNYEFSVENIKDLKARFEVEDFSKSKEQIETERKERSEESANQENAIVNR